MMRSAKNCFIGNMRLVGLFFFSVLILYCNAQHTSTDSLLKILNKNFRDEEKAPILLKIADNYQNDELYRESLKFYQKVLPIYESQHDTASMATALKNIGNVYLNLYDLEKAIDYCLRALKIYEAVNDTNECLSVLNKLGSIYFSFYNQKKALEYYMMAYEMSKEAKNYRIQCDVLNNIGGIYLGEYRDWEKALEYFRESLQVAKIINDTITISSQFQNISQVYLETKEYDSVLHYLTKALSIDIRYNNKKKIASNYINMANLCIRTNKIEKAGEYLNKAIIIANEIGNKGLKRIIYNLYTLYFAIKGNLDEMWRYTRLSENMGDSLFSEQSERLITEMQTKYETGKKEQQIKMLKTENELKESKLKIRSFWLKISILTLIFIVVFIIMKRRLFFTQKHLVRKNLEIVESERKIDPISSSEIHNKKPGFNEQDIEPPNKYTGSQLTEEQKTEIEKLLNEYFNKNKNYLNTDYSISDLANDLNINRNYLSQVINEKFHQNFNSLVNERRIKVARKIMSEESSQKYTIEYMAGSVGYKSRTAFNNAFKKYVGVTPSFYMKSIRDS